jgi:uncharacterized protein YndB with AHSA1/START domain
MARNDDSDVLELRMVTTARPETVFRFLSDPIAFEQWMGAGSSIGTGLGGAVRVVYPNGHVAAGIIEEIVPNKRVVMSWGYEDGVNNLPPGATRVEISLSPHRGGTLVTLRHSGLRDATQRRNHRAGWRHYLSSLSQLATSKLDGMMGSILDTYISAWAERDPLARRRLLEQCWAEDGVFQDAMGYAEGLDELDDYIATAQRFAPNVVMTNDGTPSRSHGFVNHRWRMIGPDGTTMMTGTNTLELTDDGRIRSVIGFWDRPASAV